MGRKEKTVYTTKIDGTKYTIYTSTNTAILKRANKSELVFRIPDKLKIDGKNYTVVGIADKAFKGCAYLDTVTIPESVERIGEYAFKGCKALEHIKPPKKTEIADTAFVGCKGIKK